MDDDLRLVRPDGLAVRRRRHELRYSPRDLVEAIARASQRATGLRETVTPNLLQGVEEQAERIPFATLRLIAGGLECDTVDILGE